MAIPTKERTWNFRVNRVIPSASTGELAATVLWHVKEMLVDSGATVVGSCDSVSFGLDTVDRWVTAPVVTVSGRNAWMVLALPTGTQVTVGFRYTTGSGGSLTGFIAGTSSVGFSGGNLTAFPSASDMLLTYNNTTTTAAPLLPSATWTGALVFHGMCDLSGDAVRWFLASSGSFACFNVLDKIADPVASKVNARMAFSLSGDNLASLGAGGTGISTNCASWVDNARISNMFGLLAFRTGTNVVTSANMALGLGVNQLLDEWPMYPMAVFSEVNGYRGFWGRIKDLYSVPSDSSIIAGVTLPADNSRQWLCTGGDFAVPWNGSIPLVA